MIHRTREDRSKGNGPCSKVWHNPKTIAALLKHPRIPGKSVYVIGSGFSRPLDIPVIADFVPLGLNILKGNTSSDGKGWRESKETIEKVIEIANDYRRKLTGVLDHEPTIEDLFCMADLLGGRGAKNKRGPTEQSKILAEFVRKVCALGYERHEQSHSAQCRVPRAHFLENASRPLGHLSTMVLSILQIALGCAYTRHSYLRCYLNPILTAPAFFMTESNTQGRRL